MRRLTLRRGLLLAVLLSCWAWAAVGPAAAGKLSRELARESTIEQVIRRGVLRVGMDIFVPWAMRDKHGELIGFEIDVARRLAEDMGVEARFVPTKWSGIIPALLSGKFDVIIGGMSMTPQRNLKVNFTDPYYYTTQGLLANRGKTAGFTLADFDRPGIVIAARLGSTAAIAARRHFPRATIRLFDDEPTAVQEVRNGRAHGLVASQPLPAHLAADEPQVFTAFNDPLFREPISFAVVKGDVDTLNYFNNWIEFQRSRGWIQERYQYWFLGREWKDRVQ